MTEQLYLKVKIVGTGMHPEERLIEIEQATGVPTQTFAWIQQLKGEFLRIREPVLSRPDGCLLVELPQETIAGYWRIWISPEQLKYEANIRV